MRSTRESIKLGRTISPLTESFHQCCFFLVFGYRHVIWKGKQTKILVIKNILHCIKVRKWERNFKFNVLAQFSLLNYHSLSVSSSFTATPSSMISSIISSSVKLGWVD